MHKAHLVYIYFFFFYDLAVPRYRYIVVLCLMENHWFDEILPYFVQQWYCVSCYHTYVRHFRLVQTIYQYPDTACSYLAMYPNIGN